MICAVVSPSTLPTSPRLFIDNTNLEKFASLNEAAGYVAKQHHPGSQTVDVFQYHNSTYVLDDHNGNGMIDNHDGLIKLVGTTGLTVHDFL